MRKYHIDNFYGPQVLEAIMQNPIIALGAFVEVTREAFSGRVEGPKLDFAAIVTKVNRRGVVLHDTRHPYRESGENKNSLYAPTLVLADGDEAHIPGYVTVDGVVLDQQPDTHYPLVVNVIYFQIDIVLRHRGDIGT